VGALRCQLLALDLDGTALDSDRRLPEDTAKAIERARVRGIEVVLCSGRMLCSVEIFWRRLGLTSPIIGYNGAYAHQPHTREVFFYEPVPYEMTLGLVRLARDRGLHVHTYIDDELWVAERNAYVCQYERNYQVTARVVGDLATTITGPSIKVLFVVRDRNIDCLCNELRELYRDRLFVTQSEGIHVELLNIRANKGSALDAVADHLGLSADAVVAVGDGVNDIEMLRWAGTGVAVGNAHPRLREEADLVLPDHPGALVSLLDRLEP